MERKSLVWSQLIRLEGIESQRHNRPTSKLIKLQKKLRKHQQSNSTTYRRFNHRNNLGKLPAHIVENRWEPSQRKSQRQRAHKLYEHIFPGTYKKGGTSTHLLLSPCEFKEFYPKDQARSSCRTAQIAPKVCPSRLVAVVDLSGDAVDSIKKLWTKKNIPEF